MRRSYRLVALGVLADRKNEFLLDIGRYVQGGILAVLVFGALPTYPQEIITCVAGNGSYGYSGDGGPATATQAALSVRPYTGGTAVDAAGNFYIADTGNNRIRRVNLGVAGNGVQGFSGDGEKATRTGTWTFANSHVAEGKIKALAVDPFDPFTVYAGTESHGVFKSTNAGADWSQTGLKETGINVLAVDSSHPDTLYAGTEGRGLLKTTDGGITWSGAGPDIPNVNLLTIDPRNSNALIAGRRDYEFSDDFGINFGILFRSTDGGRSWTQIIFPSQWTLFVAIDPVNPDVIYLTDSGYLGIERDVATLWKSTDGGKTWDGSSLHDIGDIAHLVVDPTESRTLYAYGSGFAALRSTDGAKTWTPYILPIETIVADPANTQTLYATATSRGIVCRSDDSGGTWDCLTDGLTVLAQSLAVSGSNPGMVFAGTLTGEVFKSASGLTIDRSEYCVGGSWKLGIVNAPGGAAIRLVGVSNGVPWEWPGWGTTGSGGNYNASGAFLEGSQGSHSLQVEIGGIKSNVVFLSIYDCVWDY